MKRSDAVRFRRVREEDLPLLAEWLARPHVAEWWGSSAPVPSMDELREDYLPHPEDVSAAKPYLAFLGDVPVGYIQSYVAAEAGGGWWPEERDRGVAGIDLFLADEHLLGQGLGTQLVSAFVDLLFQDGGVTRIQADPAPSNVRAIRCYLKAGFRSAGEIVTPDGPAVLLVIERSSPEGRGASASRL